MHTAINTIHRQVLITCEQTIELWQPSETSVYKHCKHPPLHQIKRACIYKFIYFYYMQNSYRLHLWHLDFSNNYAIYGCSTWQNSLQTHYWQNNCKKCDKSMERKEIFNSQQLKTSIIGYKTMNYAQNSQQKEIAKQKNQLEL